MEAPFVSQMVAGARLSPASPAETGLEARPVRLKDEEDGVRSDGVDNDCSGESASDPGTATKSGSGTCASVAGDADESGD